MLSEKMHRVSKQKPCPVCGKPDWCLFAEDGSAAICARIEQGCVKQCGDAGWLHIFRENVHNVPKVIAKGQQLIQISPLFYGERKDFESLAVKCQKQLTGPGLNLLAGTLGVSAQSLKRIGVGWDGKAYTFPMFNDFGKVIGIRRRFQNGCKLSATGSRTGLFIPAGLSPTGLLLIVEGESDLAASLTLGFEAIGRPNCNSKVEMTIKAVRGRSQVVIIGDNDPPGRKGAEILAQAMVLHYTNVKIVYPPAGVKDLRQWLQVGLTHEKLQTAIDRTVPIKININFTNRQKTAEAARCRKQV